MAYVLKYIEEGEHQRQDFKLRIDDSRKIANTLSAFSNTDGGRILIGVKDNGKVVGVNVEEEFHMMEAAAEMYLNPPISFESTVWVVDFKRVLEITVSKSNRKPHFAIDKENNKQAYFRAADQNLKANNVMVKAWKNSTMHTSVEFEYTPDEQRLFDFLNSRKKVGFKRASMLLRKNHRDTEDILAKLIGWEVLDMKTDNKGVYFTSPSNAE